jgi:hypothetical protein
VKRSRRAIRTFALSKNSVISSKKAVESRILIPVFLIVATALFALRWTLATSDPAGLPVDPDDGCANVFLTHGFMPAAILNRRLVYPYSVIPGGISSAEELREIAEHDSVVAAHYSGFDYRNARLVEVTSPRLVYLSYRRNDKIFWTHRQATLHPGEKLLTDGRTTARTRCGNQISVLPQANISPAEPMLAELERPDAVASGIEHLFPGKLESNLFQIDPELPAGPLSSGPLRGSVWPGAYMPLPIGPSAGPGLASHPPSNNPPSGGNPPTGNPPVPPAGNPPGGNPPTGGPPTIKPPTTTLPPVDNPPASNPPSENPLPGVPEPGTAVLTVSGAIAIVLRLRTMSRR